MQGWIVSVVAVIVLGVMLEIVLPDGKITKYVKGTFSLLVIFVIIAPLPKLLKSEYNFDFQTAWQNANQTFAEETKDGYFDEKEDALERYLAFYGYDCNVQIEKASGFLQIENVYVTVYGANFDIEELKDLVQNNLKIDREKIRIVIKQEKNDDV